MKREGRQHGMVRTSRIMPAPFNPITEPRFINRLESPPTAGLFTKVSTKPTNHSKFTGKCGRPKCSDCHVHPACKSKDKTKGTNKPRFSCDVSSNYGLLVNGKPTGLKKFSGSSATGILGHLGSDESPYLDHDDDYEGECADVVEEIYESGVQLGAPEMKINDNDDEDEDKMSFCDLGIFWEHIDEGDEDWCLVENNVIIGS